MKKIIFGDEAKKSLQNGIDTVADCVKITLGAKGRFVALDRSYTSPLITNDGVTIAKDIELPNEFENMGVKLVCEASSKTNSDSGDGTTTAIVLAQAMVNEGLKSISSGANPIFVKKGMEKAVNEVVRYIAENSKPISGMDDIKKVATISSRNGEYGKIIAEVMDKIGNDGVITVEESQTDKTTYEIVKGISFDKGYISPYMTTNPEKMEAVLENPYILITDQKITNIQDILHILEFVSNQSKPLLIISDDIGNEALGVLVTNKMRGTLNVVCVKAPSFGSNREDWLEDIAVLTGGKYISQKNIGLIKNATPEDLGVAKQVKVSKLKTTIIEGLGDKDEIQKRMKSIRHLLFEASVKFEQEKYKERLARFSNGVAIIKVGASTEIEMNDKKLRLEDALAATKAAVEEGIVPGGGIALLDSVKVLNSLSEKLNNDEKIGVEIIKKAIQYPVKRIIENAGYESAIVINEINKNSNKNLGFDVYTEQYVDMIENGIIDPAKVTRIALQNAFSVAGMVITTEVLITDDKNYINEE